MTDSAKLPDFFDHNPYNDGLGIRLAACDVGKSEFILDIESRHLNRTNTLHGGVIAAMLDAACGYAGLRLEGDTSNRDAVTIMLSICYLGAVEKGRITASGQLTTRGHRLYFASGELRADDGRLLATAQGSYKIARSS